MATLVASSSSMRVRKDACQKDLRLIYAAVDPPSHSIFSFQFQVYAKTNLEAKCCMSLVFSLLLKKCEFDVQYR